MTPAAIADSQVNAGDGSGSGPTGRTAPASLDVIGVTAGLRMRVLLPLGIALVVLVTSLVLFITLAREKSGEQESALSASAVQSMLLDHTEHEVGLMRSIMELLMRDEHLQAALRERNRAALLALAAPILEKIRAQNHITGLNFILPDRTMLLRTETPERYGDRIDRAVLREAERTGRPAWLTEPGSRGNFNLRVAYPWRADGRLLGYLEMSVPFGFIAAGIKSTLRVDLLLAIDKSQFDPRRWNEAVAGRTPPVAWDEFPSSVLLVRTTTDIPPQVREYLSRAPARLRSFGASWEGRSADVSVSPFHVSGERIGELLVIRETTVERAEQRVAIQRVVALGVLVGCSLMLFFYLLLGRVQVDVAARTARLNEARQGLMVEQQDRHRAEQELALQQDRNELLEVRSRVVDELAAAKHRAETALLENEQASRKLQEMQAVLVDTARAAGRAEIATNVLHNVGNVLNSVNVSAGVISSSLRKSRLPGLARALQLMREQQDLAHYVTRDPTGRRVLGYLYAAADALAQEQREMLREVVGMNRSVDHIKDIVATQQGHATGGDVIEPVKPEELVEEALRMQGTALARHRVDVVREFERVPTVCVDRSRVLQILVNLISNAKNAMGAGAAPGESPRKLTIRIESAGATRLRFLVRDEGEGIPPENLPRIFEHGFTTRAGGHGFGLHSSALAAQSMGGTLDARSEGAGKGATFVLEVPTAAEVAAPVERSLHAT